MPKVSKTAMYKITCPDCTPLGANTGPGGWRAYAGFWFWKKWYWKTCKLCNGMGEINHD